MLALSQNANESSVELLLGARSGNNDALNQLLDRYLPRLSRWASGRLPKNLRTMLDTGDVVQDAIISALPHLSTLEVRTERAFWVYLKQIVRYRIIDLHKRASRRPMRHEMPEDVPTAAPTPLEAAIGAEALERYEVALDSLTKEEFRAVVLRTELGLGYKDIATELGKASPDAARMAVSRAIKRLAVEMKRLQAVSTLEQSRWKYDSENSADAGLGGTGEDLGGGD